MFKNQNITYKTTQCIGKNVPSLFSARLEQLFLQLHNFCKQASMPHWKGMPAHSLTDRVMTSWPWHITVTFIRTHSEFQYCRGIEITAQTAVTSAPWLASQTTARAAVPSEGRRRDICTARTMMSLSQSLIWCNVQGHIQDFNLWGRLNWVAKGHEAGGSSGEVYPSLLGEGIAPPQNFKFYH